MAFEDANSQAPAFDVNQLASNRSMLRSDDGGELPETRRTGDGFQMNYMVFIAAYVFAFVFFLMPLFVPFVAALLKQGDTDGTGFAIISLIGLLGGVLCAAVGSITYLVFLGRAWGLVQDGKAPIRPWLAIVGFFIPLLNIFWPFVAICGLAFTMKAFGKRWGIRSGAMPTITLSVCLSPYIIGIAALVAPVIIEPLVLIGVLLASFIQSLVMLHNLFASATRLADGIRERRDTAMDPTRPAAQIEPNPASADAALA